MSCKTCRTRIAPTPTGFLHIGHAVTFHQAWRLCREQRGQVVFRNEDIDPLRCKPEFAAAALEDLRWLGLDWNEGPDIGGPFASYNQSQRLPLYRDALEHLYAQGHIYPSTASRKDIASHSALHPSSPDEQDAEPLFPTLLRQAPGPFPPSSGLLYQNWRFRVPDGRSLHFKDAFQGPCSYTAGADFGDFLVWRKDGMPSYELAVVVDDLAMAITHVFRGLDLLRSTARQILLYEALSATPPVFGHLPLIRDSQGRRLAKRYDSLSLRTLRQNGVSPQQILSSPQSFSG